MAVNNHSSITPEKKKKFSVEVPIHGCGRILIHGKVKSSGRYLLMRWVE